eukprot:1196328-Prorocentrum_minimum.AAC.3
MKSISSRDEIDFSAWQTAAEKERRLQEVQALAAMGSHPNIVRYYSAWFETDVLYLQVRPMCQPHDKE